MGSNDWGFPDFIQAATAQSVEPQPARKIHLIIPTISIKRSDEITFGNAAVTLRNSYRSSFPGRGHEIVVKKANTGKEIVSIINSYPRNSIASLDLISHGNQGGIHIAQKLSNPLESGWLQKRAHVRMRTHSDRPQTEQDAEFMEESMHGLYSGRLARTMVSYYFNQTYDKKEVGGKLVGNEDTALLSEIDFSVFSDDAYVEFHGCRVAEYIQGLNDLADNFAENFSEGLSPDSLVVGHITNSAPDKNPNGNRDDYRYGKIRAYKSGKAVKDGVERWGLKFENSSTPP